MQGGGKVRGVQIEGEMSKGNVRGEMSGPGGKCPGGMSAGKGPGECPTSKTRIK